jgi:hypothetical protein
MDVSAVHAFTQLCFVTDTASARADINSMRSAYANLSLARIVSPVSADAFWRTTSSNSYRSHVWKHQLQRVADKLDMSIHVSHFPPGTSKWNKAEHRLFSFISPR